MIMLSLKIKINELDRNSPLVLFTLVLYIICFFYVKKKNLWINLKISSWQFFFVNIVFYLFRPDEVLHHGNVYFHVQNVHLHHKLIMKKMLAHVREKVVVWNFAHFVHQSHTLDHVKHRYLQRQQKEEHHHSSWDQNRARETSGVYETKKQNAKKSLEIKKKKWKFTSGFCELKNRFFFLFFFLGKNNYSMMSKTIVKKNLILEFYFIEFNVESWRYKANVPFKLQKIRERKTRKEINCVNDPSLLHLSWTWSMLKDLRTLGSEIQTSFFFFYFVWLGMYPSASFRQPAITPFPSGHDWKRNKKMKKTRFIPGSSLPSSHQEYQVRFCPLALALNLHFFFLFKM